MRECPCCGFKDPPYWRNVRQRLYTMYCEISSLEFNEPSLATQLKEHKKKYPKPKDDIIIGNYIYHYMPKTGIVQRIHIQDSRDGKTIREPEQEKHFKFVPMGQRKLAPFQYNATEGE